MHGTWCKDHRRYLCIMSYSVEAQRCHTCAFEYCCRPAGHRAGNHQCQVSPQASAPGLMGKKECAPDHIAQRQCDSCNCSIPTCIQIGLSIGIVCHGWNMPYHAVHVWYHNGMECAWLLQFEMMPTPLLFMHPLDGWQQPVAMVLGSNLWCKPTSEVGSRETC